MVAGGKSNDLLMQWYCNALCLALALALAPSASSSTSASASSSARDTSHLAKLSLPNISYLVQKMQ